MQVDASCPSLMKRILIVDDSPAARSLCSAALSEIEGISVERVSTGLEALRLLRSMPIDLVLTDVHMPEISGLELIRFIKATKSTEATPVIVMSTEANQEDRDRGLALGADGFLAKPFTTEDLRLVISQYLQAERR